MAKKPFKVKFLKNLKLSHYFCY